MNKLRTRVESSFHTELQRLRVEAGYTQVELARRTGISQPRIAILEAGGARPSKQVAERLAEALGVAPRIAYPNYDELKDMNHVARVQHVS